MISLLLYMNKKTKEIYKNYVSIKINKIHICMNVKLFFNCNVYKNYYIFIKQKKIKQSKNQTLIYHKNIIINIIVIII